MSTQISERSAMTSAVRGRPWPKGISGNPGGRPKVVADVRALARQLTAGALNALAEIMEDTEAPAASRIAAAKELLDRGWGKPITSVVAVTAEAETSHRVPEDTLDLEIAVALASAKESASLGFAWCQDDADFLSIAGTGNQSAND